MSNEIKLNLVYLTDKLTNLEKLILHLMQEGVFSKDERERILYGQTTLDRNAKFWDLLERKDWESNRSKFLHILRQTKNGHCADKIEGLTQSEEDNCGQKIVYPILKNKWWPEVKCLPKAFQERKLENGVTLIEELYRKLTENKGGSTVICQGATVSGLGGVGKTTMAKWFAQHYQNLYDQIIWIDCGEESLNTSFTDLANELDIINPNLRLNILAKKCFLEFQGLKCLCIFDNAESYQGPQGIRQVLPKLENIHSIITSRTREWGSESGDGRISQLQLNIFDTVDSIIFLEKNLKYTDLYTKDQLKELSEILGNLPLALQIAVQTINSKKISSDDYLTRIKTTPHILNQNFDDYENTINKTMKISLDIIKNHESDYKQLAYNILLIFGYIQPDSVDLDFFQEIEKATKYEVQEAVELLEKYSLITCRSQGWADIHRLLQQVIRHNSKDIENSLLRKILLCGSTETKDFVGYKLIPYSFANEELQEEFPRVKAQLIDQIKLKELMQERKFAEAVKLSLIIKNTLNHAIPDYNHAHCLLISGNCRKALEILDTVYIFLNVSIKSNTKELQCYDRNSATQIADSSLSFGINQTGILDLRADIKIELVAGLRLLANLKAGNYVNANRVMNEENLLLIPGEVDYYLDEILQFLGSTCSIPNYKLYNICSLIFVSLDERVVGKKIKLNNCSISGNLPCDLKELELTRVNVLTEIDNPLEYLDISSVLMSANLRHLKIQCGNKTTIFYLKLFQHKMPHLSHIFLSKCVIILTENSKKLSPIELEMNEVIFMKDQNEVRSLTLNEYVNFNKTLQLRLTCSAKTDIYFDPNCPMNVHTVFLSKIKILNFQTLIWNISKLTLENMIIPLLCQPVKMKLTHLEMRNSIINLSSLVHITHDVEKITLDFVKVKDNSFNFPITENLSIGANEVNITDLQISRTIYFDYNNVYRVSDINDILQFEKINNLSLTSVNEDGGHMVLDLNESFSMETLHLENTTPINWKNSKCSFTKLTLRNVDISFLRTTRIFTKELKLIDAVVDWNFLVDISRNNAEIDLRRTKIIKRNKVTPFLEYLHSTKVTSDNVIFFAPNGDEIENVLVNELIKFNPLRELKLSCGQKKQNLNLDLKGITQLDHIYLNNVKLENLLISEWNFDEAVLLGNSLIKKSQLKIRNLTFGNASIDLSCLPRNIEMIHLEETSTIVSNNHPPVLPDLNKIRLPFQIFSKVIQNLYFCTNLTCIELRMTSNFCTYQTDVYNVDLKLFPNTIRKIKLIQLELSSRDKRAVQICGERVLQLEKLVLENFCFEQFECILSKLKPDVLVFVRNKGIPSSHMNNILDWFGNPCKKFVIGRVDGHFSNNGALKYPFCNSVNKLNRFFLFEKEQEIAIEETEFEKYSEF